ncbi:MAG TPA: hypothetical protein PLD40_09465, partial [Kiritimatiellia bacterium]|nr:hypothetical protein [Kiritimatiellia bacterium]HPV47797.1 hypothetical protein [Kiritimatiellia bacterium]
PPRKPELTQASLTSQKPAKEPKLNHSSTRVKTSLPIEGWHDAAVLKATVTSPSAAVRPFAALASFALMFSGLLSPCLVSHRRRHACCQPASGQRVDNRPKGLAQKKRNIRKIWRIMPRKTVY